MWPGKSYRAVICVGRHGAAVALKAQTGVEHIDAHSFLSDVPLAVDSVEPIQALLHDVHVWLSEQVGRAFLEISLFIADPLLAHKVLGLESLPRSRRAQEELVRWRLAKELGLEQAGLSVVWSAVREAGTDSAVSLHAMALTEELHAMLISGFHRAGWPVVRLGSLAQAVGDGRLTAATEENTLDLYVGDDYWLANHCDSGVLRQVRCRWFEQDDQALNREIARALNVEGVTAVRLVSFESGSEKLQAVRAVVEELLGEDALLGLSLFIDGGETQGPALQRVATLLAGSASCRC